MELFWLHYFSQCSGNEDALHCGIVACVTGYRKNGGSCTICAVNTYNAADDTSTTCTSCTSPKTTAGNNGQSDCLGEQLFSH